MSYKRVVKKKGKSYGPYVYESYRDEDGNVKKRYLGKADELKKKSYLFTGLLIFSALFIFLLASYTTDNFYNGGKISGKVIYSVESSVSNVVSGLTGLVVGEDSGDSSSSSADSSSDSGSSVTSDSLSSDSEVSVQSSDESSVEEISPEEGIVGNENGAESEEPIEVPEDSSEEVPEDISSDIIEEENEIVSDVENESDGMGGEDILEIPEVNESEQGSGDVVENQTGDVEFDNSTVELPESNDTLENQTVGDVPSTEGGEPEDSSGGSGAGDNETLNQTENVTVALNETLINETVLNFTNETLNFTLINETVVNETLTNETLNDTLVNETFLNVSLSNISTFQYKAIIRRPVKWIKKINATGNVTIELPKNSTNISILTDEEVSEAIGKIDEYESFVNSTDKQDLLDGVLITGNVALDLRSGEGILTRFWNWLKSFTISGNVILEEEISEKIIDTENSTVVDVSEVVAPEKEVAIEYYTEAPQANETELENGKQVTVYSSDEFNYTNILAYAQLDNRVALNESYKIRVYHQIISSSELDDFNTKKEKKKDVSEIVEENETILDIANETSLNETLAFENESVNDSVEENSNVKKDSKQKKEKSNNGKSLITGNVVLENSKDLGNDSLLITRELVNFSYYDLDGDGFIDYVEWVVPHLSEQIYEIIYISQAEHLDSNRDFVEDIYDSVKDFDGNWSSEIPGDEYVRVTFEEMLDNTRDITIYSRAVNLSSGNVSVEVYEMGGNEILATFENVSDESFYKIYLTKLNGTRDIFDLKTVCGANPSCGVEYDYIVDPSLTYYWVGSGSDWSSSASWASSSGGAGGAGVPDSSDAVIFDSNSGDSVIDSSFLGGVSQLNMTSDYSGTITQNTDLNITDDFNMYGGVWQYTSGTAASLNVSGNMYVNSTVYTPYSSTSGNGTGRNFTIGGDLTVDVGGLFNGTGMGFGYHAGPGAAISIYGASYGGEGGVYNDATKASSPTYGSITAPLDLGSGGDSFGGGALFLNVSGSVVLEGEILEEGLYTSNAGSGGSVYILADSISGNGIVSVNGGNSTHTSGGGGGRISVKLNTGTDFGDIGFTAYGGNSIHSTSPHAGAGTIYLKDADDNYGLLKIDNAGQSTTKTTLINSSVYYDDTGIDFVFDKINLTNYGALKIAPTKNLNLTNTVLTGDGNINSKLILYYGNVTLGSSFDYSNVTISQIGLGQIVFDTNLTLGSGAKLTHEDNGGSNVNNILNLSVLGDMVVESGASVNVSGFGYKYGLGPGGAGGNDAGSYGGEGGTYTSQTKASPSTYGSITAPVDLGSGGGYSNGGGAVFLNVSGSLDLEGFMVSESFPHSATGSGGSVYIYADNLSGSGYVSVRGGNSTNTAGGGGGRISVNLNSGTDFGGVSFYASGGYSPHPTTPNGGAGTIYLKDSNEEYGELIIDNSDLSTVKTALISQNVTDTTVGDVIIRNAGYLKLNDSQSLTVYGDWNNTGSFNANDSSTVVLAGSTNTTIYENETFYNLNVTKKGGYVFFPSLTSVTGFFVFGSRENNSHLRATDSSWSVDVSGEQGIYFADVKDSTSVTGTLFGYSSEDLGSNSGWEFFKPFVEFTGSTPETGSSIGTSMDVSVVANSSYVNSTSYIPLDSGLVSWWRMDDLNGTGGVVDYMGLNNGTVVGNAAQGVGYEGYGFDLNYSDGKDYIYAADSDSLSPSNITVALWFKKLGTTAGGLIEKWGTPKEYRIFSGYEGRIAWRVSSTGDLNEGDIASYENYSDGEWHQVVGTYDGSRTALYVDGVLKNYTDYSGGIFAGSNVLAIGASVTGSVDDAMIWNRSLSEKEVAELYSNMSHKYISTFVDFDNSLVSWWRMDDLNSTGGLVDYLGRNNGTVVGNATQVDGGYIGKAFNFDGNGDYINGPGSDSFNVVDELTMSLWVNPNEVSDDDILFQKGNGSTITNSYWIGHWGSVTVDLWENSSSHNINSFDYVLNVGSWQHLVATWNGDVVSLYVDGVLNGSNATTISSLQNIPSAYWGIGAIGSTGGYPFNGSIDDVMIFNRSLTADEIEVLYANQTTKSFETSFSGLGNGSHVLTAYSQDLIGNVNSTETRTLTVDAIAPTVNIYRPINGSYYNSVLFNVSSSEEGLNGSIVPNLDNSLISWYRMDDYNSTHLFDYFGRNNGTIQSGNVTVNSSGKYGKSFDFNGLGDGAIGGVGAWVDLPDDLIVHGQNFTISLWMNPAADNSSMFAFGTSAANRVYIGTATSATGGVLNVNKGGAKISPADISAIPGTWYHMVLVHQYSTGNQLNKFYLDGVLNNTNISTDESSIGNINLGSYNDGNSGFFNGSIDDVMIWNRTLSAEEILSLHNAMQLEYGGADLDNGEHTYSVYSQDTSANVGSADAGTFIVDSDYPTIDYVSPTLENRSVIGQNYTEVNVSSTDASSNISTFVDGGSLVSWWRMDDLNSSGGLVDYMGLNNGTVFNEAHQVDDGKFGKAFSFDGDGDYVATSITDFDNVTFSLWIKPKSFSSGYSLLFGGGNSPYSGFIPYADTLRFYYSGDGNVYLASSGFNSGNYPTDIFTHLTGTVQTINSTYSNISIYRNGVLLANDIRARDGGSFVTLNIGGGYFSSFNGSIDDVMIFNRSLSAEEVVALYANTSSKYVDVNLTGLHEGDNEIVSYSQDYAGNVNSTSRIINVDTTSPTVTINSPLSQNYGSTTVAFDVDYLDVNGGSLIPNLDNSLVSWWRMDDVNTTGEGALVSDYMGRNDGVAVGNAVQNFSGKFGKSFSFDGDGDYINVGGDSSLKFSDELSISAWVNSGDPVSLRRIMSVDAPLHTSTGYDFFVYNNEFGFQIGNGSTNDYIYSIGNISSNEWYFVSGVFDGGNLTIYVNGMLNVSNTTSLSGIDYGTQTVLIGALNQSGTMKTYWDGSLDDIMIFNRSLSADEIVALYNATAIDHSDVLSVGTHSYTVYGQDVAGNVGSDASYFSVGLDPVNGYVFDDVDYDGVMDVGETGFRDVTIRVWNDTDMDGTVSVGDTPETSGRTNASGFFNISTFCETCLVMADGSDVSLYSYRNTTNRIVNLSSPGEVNFGWRKSMNSNGQVSSSLKITDGQDGFGPGLLDAGKRFGESVSVIGDLNGDGINELAVGAVSDGGTVYILFLNSTGGVTSVTQIEDSVGGMPSGISSSFGWDCESIGDFNKDGTADLAVLASGTIYLLFLNSTGGVQDYTSIAENVGGFPYASVEWGNEIANLGDLDNDGIIDLVVGATADENDTGGDSAEGAVFVLFLNSTGGVSNVTKITDGQGGFGPSLLEADDGFGVSVAGIGDLNGDGINDMAVGAQKDENDTSAEDKEGAVYILFLNSTGGVESSVKIAEGQNGFNPDVALEANDNFGHSVSSIGDLDGDGVVDLLVGNHWDETNTSDASEGTVTLLFLNSTGGVKDDVLIGDGVSGFEPEYLNGSDLFGQGVSYLGDFNGDGIPDLVVGAPGDENDAGSDAGEGAAYILFMTQGVSDPSAYKFEVQNSVGTTVASFDDKGDAYFMGSINQNQGSLNPPANSFIVEDNGGSTVAYISDSGSLYLLGAVSTGGVAGLTSSNLEFRNATNDLVSFFDNQGNLKLNGGYLTSYSTP